MAYSTLTRHQALPLSFLFFLFLSSSSLPKAASNRLVPEGACMETINYAKCMEALGSNPGAKSAMNLKEVANVSLQLAIAVAKERLVFIKLILKNNSNPPLKRCASCYEVVVASFESALGELAKYDAMTANYDVKMAGDDVDECENNELVSKGIKFSIHVRPELSR